MLFPDCCTTITLLLFLVGTLTTRPPGCPWGYCIFEFFDSCDRKSHSALKFQIVEKKISSPSLALSLSIPSCKQKWAQFLISYLSELKWSCSNKVDIDRVIVCVANVQLFLFQKKLSWVSQQRQADKNIRQIDLLRPHTWALRDYRKTQMWN